MTDTHPQSAILYPKSKDPANNICTPNVQYLYKQNQKHSPQALNQGYQRAHINKDTPKGIYPLIIHFHSDQLPKALDHKVPTRKKIPSVFRLF